MDRMNNSEFEDQENVTGVKLPFKLTAIFDSKGSTCNIYKAKVFGKWIIIKELKEQYASNVKFIELFKKEQELGVTLNHPNLPRYEILAEQISDKNWVAMEFIEGDTLADFIKSHPTYFEDADYVEKFIKETASAIRYLHSRQILHLDIKPDNILITKIGNNVKLIDLGFCHSDVFQGTEGLTIGFESPERKLGIRSETDDYYGLGKLIEFLRINTPKFPLRKFKGIERDLLSDNPAERTKAFNQIEKRPKADNKRQIWYAAIFFGTLLVFGFIAYLALSNHGGIPANQDGHLIEKPESAISNSDNDSHLDEGRELQNVNEWNEDNKIVTPESKLAVDNALNNSGSNSRLEDKGDLPNVKGRKEENKTVTPEVNNDPSNRKRIIYRLKDLKKDIQSNLKTIFTPIGNRIRDNIRKGDYSEREYNDLNKEIREAIHKGMQIEAYIEKYPDLDSDVIADTVGSEMQATEGPLWLADWKIYEKEFNLRQAQAK